MRLTVIYPSFLLALAYIPPVVGSCGTLAECISRGRELVHRINDARADTVGLPAKYAAKYPALEMREIVENTFKQISDIMAGIPFAIPQELTKVTIDNEAKGDIAYQNSYGKGFIAATANYRSYDPVPTTDQVHWDVIAFEQYRAAGFASADLTYILQHTVDNQDTRRLLNELYAEEPQRDQTKWFKWDLFSPDNSDGFYALLGTPLGNGPGYILVDYAGTMDRRSVAAIHTRKWGFDWMMVVEFTRALQNSKETPDFIFPFVFVQFSVVPGC
jgi:hypothetical protein